MGEEACPPKKIKLSWSKLKNWETCHKRVQLQSEGKKSPIINGRGFLPGTLADRAMRMWLEEGKFDHGGMEKFIPQIWEEHTGKNAEYRIEWKGDVTEDQKAVLKRVRDCLQILEPILMEKVVPFAFKPEYRFTSVVGVPGLNGETVNIEIFGAVDVAVQMSPERYGLYDLKITDNADYIRSTLAQLVFYDLAFRGFTGITPVEHAFWAPLLPISEKKKSPAVIPLTVTNNERMQMISRIIKFCHGVWRNEWELTPDTNQCFNCPVKHACPRWTSPITKDEQGRNRTSFSRAKFDTMSVDES